MQPKLRDVRSREQLLQKLDMLFVILDEQDIHETFIHKSYAAEVIATVT